MSLIAIIDAEDPRGYDDPRGQDTLVQVMAVVRDALDELPGGVTVEFAQDGAALHILTERLGGPCEHPLLARHNLALRDALNELIRGLELWQEMKDASSTWDDRDEMLHRWIEAIGPDVAEAEGDEAPGCGPGVSGCESRRSPDLERLTELQDDIAEELRCPRCAEPVFTDQRYTARQIVYAMASAQVNRGDPAELLTVMEDHDDLFTERLHDMPDPEFHKMLREYRTLGCTSRGTAAHCTQCGGTRADHAMGNAYLGPDLTPCPGFTGPLGDMNPENDIETVRKGDCSGSSSCQCDCLAEGGSVPDRRPWAVGDRHPCGIVDAVGPDGIHVRTSDFGTGINLGWEDA